MGTLLVCLFKTLATINLMENRVEIFPELEQRRIAIILGTGAENLGRLGFNVGHPKDYSLAYYEKGRQERGSVQLYPAEVGGTGIHLLSRHAAREGYVPAYQIDHRANMLALVDDEDGAGADVILGSSLVGGCRTTNWEVGDIILVRDGIDEHPDDQHVDGNQPYVHAQDLFDGKVSDILLEAAKRKDIPVRDGGIYYSGPSTTGNRFETPAEMAKLLAHVYLRQYLDRVAELVGVGLEEFDERWAIKEELEPNLVGMTLVREAGYARTISTRRAYPIRFGGFAVISDFPEDEETEHGKNLEVALEKLPVVMDIFAEAIPEINRGLRERSL